MYFCDHLAIRFHFFDFHKIVGFLFVSLHKIEFWICEVYFLYLIYNEYRGKHKEKIQETERHKEKFQETEGHNEKRKEISKSRVFI